MARLRRPAMQGLLGPTMGQVEAAGWGLEWRAVRRRLGRCGARRGSPPTRFSLPRRTCWWPLLMAAPRPGRARVPNSPSMPRTIFSNIRVQMSSAWSGSGNAASKPTKSLDRLALEDKKKWPSEQDFGHSQDKCFYE